MLDLGGDGRSMESGFMTYWGSIVTRSGVGCARWAASKAGMAELADAADSKSAEGNLMGVRFPLPAPIKSILYETNASSDAFSCAQTVPKMSIIAILHWSEPF